MQKRTFTKEQVYQKLKHYCAWQPRCRSEAREKIFSFGLKRPEAEELLSRLVDDGFLNEEKFAVLFAAGRFGMKQWGRKKIKAALNAKRVSPAGITKALREIDSKKYTETLQRLAGRKWKSVNGAGVNLFVKMTKTRNYLLQKGYEPQLVAAVLKELQQ
jgi:regulatory protein